MDRMTGRNRTIAYAFVIASAAAFAGCAEPDRPPPPVLTAVPPGTPSIQGTVDRVSDGDSLVVGGTRIRLHGIDTPDLRQRCGRDAGWACGEAARDRLAELTAGQVVACTPREVDALRRTVAVCTAGGRDLGRALVLGGYAVAFTQYSRDYQAEEAEARAAKRGVWSGPFERPDEWREANRTR